jgi:uncharacterized membrane protein YesL
MDGPLMKYGNMLADMVILSFLWIIFGVCTLFIGVGAATSAAYYVATRRISDKEGYLVKDFFTAFKREFFRSTVVFGLLAVVAIVIVYNIWSFLNPEYFMISVFVDNIFLTLQFVVLLEILLIALYIFPILSRFTMRKRELLKTAFFMANRHIFSTIGIAAILAGLVLAAAIIFPVFILGMLLVPGIYFYLSSYLFMRIFRKYRPEIDAAYEGEGFVPLNLGGETKKSEGNSIDNKENKTERDGVDD